MANDITFTVIGTPITEGSMMGIPFRRKGGKMGVNLIHTKDKQLKGYRKSIANVADDYHDLIYSDNKDMAYAVTIIFYMEKGKSVKRQFPTVKGKGSADIDKLTRSCLDALTKNEKYKIKGLFMDDVQVIRIKATKYYVDAKHPVPQTIITVKRVLLSAEYTDLDEASIIDDDL